MTDLKENRYAHLVKQHPCYNPDAHKVNGRIHLPVSPTCNIRCRFCRREFDTTTQRPGVARYVISPAEAVGLVEKALELCPQITVVGVAGPGESLATSHALDALELVHRRFPDLIGCLSTNGLRLAENAMRSVQVGVKTVSVTVNAVNPDRLTKINGGVVIDGKLLTGIEGANTLIRAQLAGIRKAADLGLVVKTNAVLIPGLNDDHIEDIAKAVEEAGASMMNIIPLIPSAELSDIPAPDCDMLNTARATAEKYLTVFRHCRHCRADACGIPGGKDLADQLYDKRVETFSHG